NGILTISRNYAVERPHEVYRLTALAKAALESLGVANPRDHLLIVGNRDTPESSSHGNMATVMVSRQPFTTAELRGAEEVCKRLEFDILLGPQSAAEENCARLATNDGRSAVEAELGLDLRPPTDNRPFFFHMLRAEDCLRNGFDYDTKDPNLKAITVLI